MEKNCLKSRDTDTLREQSGKIKYLGMFIYLETMILTFCELQKSKYVMACRDVKKLSHAQLLNLIVIK